MSPYCFYAPLVLAFPSGLPGRRYWPWHCDPLRVREVWKVGEHILFDTFNLYAN